MPVTQPIQRITEHVLPRTMREDLLKWAMRLSRRPRVGAIQFGDMRRLTPISDDWGFDRGEPIDRLFIRTFMERQAFLVKGRVVEVGTNHLTKRYGGPRVTSSDVLHVHRKDPPTTILADLATGLNIPSDAFDCAIVTQTLQFIYDTEGAVRTLHRILRPGGVALVTVPAITRISRYDMETFGQFWSFTSKSAQRIFDDVFTPAGVQVESYGNVLAAVAFLHGVAAEELQVEELLHRDPDYEVLVTIRATKVAD